MPDSDFKKTLFHHSDEWQSCQDAIAADMQERLMRMREQWEAFLKITASVSSSAGMESVIALICDKTTQLMRAERTSVFLVEKDPQNPTVSRLHTVVAEGSSPIRLEFGQGIAGTVAKTCQSLNVKDVYQSKYFDPSQDQKTGFVTRSCLCVPIFNIQNELLGVVQIINKRSGYFTPEDEEMALSICAQIGVCLTQHRLYLNLLAKNIELHEAHERLQRRNAELDILYGLERQAANARGLDDFMELALNTCLHVFPSVATAACFAITQEQKKLFYAQTDPQNSNFPIFCMRVLDGIPPLFSQALQPETCLALCANQSGDLENTSKLLFSAPSGTALIIALDDLKTAFGCLFLGAPASATLPDTRLAKIFASHMAQAINAHIVREQLEKQRRLTAIGHMMASLLHDMKTPLANIYGYADIMVAQNDPQKRAQTAKIIERQVENLKNMSAEILQFARGQSVMAIRPENLKAIVDTALAQLAPDAASRAIALVCRIPEDLHLPCDADKIQRLIINLVKNAIEAIQHGGKVEISASLDAGTVTVTILDNGPGIPPEIADALFEPFVTSGKRSGTGLGLAIVQKIIDDHNAKISWKNVMPHGTEFVMAFPARL